LNFTNCILPHIYYINLNKDEVLWRDGDPADEVYFSMTGELSIKNDFFVSLLRIVEGNILGEFELFDNQDYVK
jgi:hypothetical protein